MNLPDIQYTPEERVELHIHSHYSDGQYSPEALVDKAAALGLRVIALTDHGTVQGVDRMIEAAGKAGIYVIPGVELNSSEGHFLGYFVDCHDKQFLAFLKSVQRMRMKRIESIVKSLVMFGFPITREELNRFASPGLPTRTTVARILVNKGFFPDIESVFTYMIGKNSPAYQTEIAPDAETCIRAIQDAGGIVVEAHPHRTHADKSEERIARFYAKMKRLGVIGCEEPETNISRFKQVGMHIKKAVERKNLLCVKGSDYHGKDVSPAVLGEQSMGSHRLQGLIERLPDQCIHKDLFSRMQWRGKNLSHDEFQASMDPKDIMLNDLSLTHLIERPPLPPLLANPKDACPYVLIGPGAQDREKTILDTLKKLGCTILSVQKTRGYFELAWDLFGTHSGTVRQKENDLLSFNLDMQLYGVEADQCTIVFFEPPSTMKLKVLRDRVKRKAGSTRFYRVQYQSLRDVCPSFRIHFPEEDNLTADCHRLREHGIIAPARNEAPVMANQALRAL